MPLNATQCHSMPPSAISVPPQCHPSATQCHPALTPYEPRCSLRPRPRANLRRQTGSWPRARAGLCGNACGDSRCVSILVQIRVGGAGCWWRDKGRRMLVAPTLLPPSRHTRQCAPACPRHPALRPRHPDATMPCARPPMLAIPNFHLPAPHRPRDPPPDTGCRMARSRGVVALGQRVVGWLGSAGLGLAATRDRPHPQDRRPGPSRPPDTGRIRPDPEATMPSRAEYPPVQECWACRPTQPAPLHCSPHRVGASEIQVA